MILNKTKDQRFERGYIYICTLFFYRGILCIEFAEQWVSRNGATLQTARSPATKISQSCGCHLSVVVNLSGHDANNLSSKVHDNFLFRNIIYTWCSFLTLASSSWNCFCEVQGHWTTQLHSCNTKPPTIYNSAHSSTSAQPIHSTSTPDLFFFLVYTSPRQSILLITTRFKHNTFQGLSAAQPSSSHTSTTSAQALSISKNITHCLSASYPHTASKTNHLINTSSSISISNSSRNNHHHELPFQYISHPPISSNQIHLLNL